MNRAATAADAALNLSQGKDDPEMSGDPNNAAVWADADVYIGGLDAETPGITGGTGTPDGSAFSSDWDLCGLLDGDDGFSESMAQENSDFFAWGGILVATTRKNFKLTRQFTPLEDNETVFDLWYAGSDLTFDGNGGYAGQIKVPDLNKKFKIGFQVQTGTVIKRVVSKNYAQVDERGDSTDGESDLSKRQLTVAIYPDSDGVLFDTYKGEIETTSP